MKAVGSSAVQILKPINAPLVLCSMKLRSDRKIVSDNVCSCPHPPFSKHFIPT